MSTDLRKATAADYPDLISFLNGIFGIRMDLEYSHIYKPTARDMGNNIIAVQDGKIVSCVGIFPMTFACGGVRLRVGGIGGVSTNPEYRSRGLMTTLMNEAMEIMRRRRDDVSILWGDRLRYARFGYENAGRRHTFNIDRRHVLPRIPAGTEIRPLSFTSGDLSRIGRLYRQSELRVERSPAKLKSVFGRYTYETWVWLKGKAFAYMTIKGLGADRDLIEFGGETEGLENLLGFLFDKYELENLTGTIPYCPSPYVPFVIAHSSGWGIGFSRRARCEMVRILDFASVLSKFAGQIGKRARRSGLTGSLTLEMTDSHQVATLHFGRRVSVIEQKATPTLRLSDTQMVRLIFGTIPPSHSLKLSKPLHYLDEVFPIDFYVPRLDWV